jgi:hypothetical protein
MAVTLPVLGKRAALSANMPPPHPTSRYFKLEVGGGFGCEAWHPRMKSCRKGFIRCRSREEPWGSHHVEASALKCETSSGLTEEVLWARNWFWTNRGAVRRRRLRLRREVGRRGAVITEPIACFASRSIRLGNGEPLQWQRTGLGRGACCLAVSQSRCLAVLTSKFFGSRKQARRPASALGMALHIIDGGSCHPCTRGIRMVRVPIFYKDWKICSSDLDLLAFGKFFPTSNNLSYFASQPWESPRLVFESSAGSFLKQTEAGQSFAGSQESHTNNNAFC